VVVLVTRIEQLDVEALVADLGAAPLAVAPKLNLADRLAAAVLGQPGQRLAPARKTAPVVESTERRVEHPADPPRVTQARPRRALEQLPDAPQHAIAGPAIATARARPGQVAGAGAVVDHQAQRPSHAIRIARP